MRVLARDDVYGELAKSLQKWLVVVQFHIDWERSPHTRHQVLAAIPWLRGDHTALNEGYAVAMCDTAAEADDIFMKVYGPANRERGEERERAGNMLIYAWVISPSGEIETDNATDSSLPSSTYPTHTQGYV